MITYLKVEVEEWVNCAKDETSSEVDDEHFGNPINLGLEEESQVQELHQLDVGSGIQNTRLMSPCLHHF